MIMIRISQLLRRLPVPRKITVNGGDVKFKIKELETKISDISRLITSILEMNKCLPKIPEGELASAAFLFPMDNLYATAGNCRIL